MESVPWMTPPEEGWYVPSGTRKVTKGGIRRAGDDRAALKVSGVRRGAHIAGTVDMAPSPAHFHLEGFSFNNFRRSTELLNRAVDFDREGQRVKEVYKLERPSAER